MVDGELRGDAGDVNAHALTIRQGGGRSVTAHEVSVRQGRVRLRRRRGPRAESLRSLATSRLAGAVAPTEDWING